MWIWLKERELMELEYYLLPNYLAYLHLSQTCPGRVPD